jgi:thymidylate synthase
MWQQRSVDTSLGLPFNILSYAILTHMVAQCVNMDVDELIFSGGDVHIYMNQLEGIQTQLRRNPYRYSLPTLNLNPEITNILDFKYEDFKIEGYRSYPTIKMPLSVGNTNVEKEKEGK